MAFHNRYAVGHTPHQRTIYSPGPSDRRSEPVFDRDLLRLRSIINHHSSIHILPPEVMVDIFFRYIGLCEAEEELIVKKSLVKHYQWLRISHICRSWRALALNNSKLWTRVATKTSLRLLRHVLQLVRSAPIHLVTYIIPDEHHDSHWKAFFQLLETHGSTLVSIDLQCPRLPSEWNIASNRYFLPNLRSFRFISNEGKNPRFIGNANAPALKDLNVFSHEFSWDANCFGSSLRTLQLTGGEPTKRPSWEELTDVLQGIRNLNSFSLHHLFPHTSNFNSFSVRRPNYDPVHLKLKHVHLKGFTTECVEFLQRFSFSSTSNVKLDMFTQRDGSHIPCFLTPILRKRFATSKIFDKDSFSTNFKTIGLRKGSEKKGTYLWEFVNLDLWTDVVTPATFFHPSSTPKTNLSLTVYSGLTDTSSLLSMMLDFFPFTVVESVCLRCREFAGQWFWQDLERRGLSGKIKHLFIEGSTAYDLPTAISTIQDRNGPSFGRPPRMAYPNIQTIAFKDLNAMKRLDHPQRTFDKALTAALRLRAKNKVSVRDVYVYKCLNVTSGTLSQFESAVKTIRWDGRQTIERNSQQFEMYIAPPSAVPRHYRWSFE